MCQEDSRYENAQLHLNISAASDVVLSVDPILIQRVLDNLFNNALKYSKGIPYIELGAYIDGQDFVIYVADHGIGISKRNIDKIFERSYTVQKSRTPGSDSGSGFGLAIVKSVMEHHNGTVVCESEPQKGSRFILRLPL